MSSTRKNLLFCKKQNHFAKVCKTKLKQQAEVNLVEQTTQHSQPSLQATQGESNNEDYLFAIGPSEESNQLLKYKRLNFGVNSGAEQFQNLIQSALAGLQGVINISDDILVYAKNQQEHNERLVKCMQRLREKSLTLNGDKCEFNKSSVEFFGHIFSSSGVSPSPTKVQSLIEAPPPSNREEVRSFLGLANYCARFIPNLASLSEPLRDLTRQSVPWSWEERHAKSFNDIKHAIAQHCHMAYFDSRLHSTVVVDASPVGLCAMLVLRQ
ncbi:hypothetical protein BSL78_09701 [Apostichopus japonicus]|uniref:Reverse transcriptase domain-containing protein n=1 Tax=Stichopus japonicus TaxID=307972 RepID=A0A2G8KZJ2_STIJA|nr:hypothetical protein BSL78_09701 [Apostichopus japonicus]